MAHNLQYSTSLQNAQQDAITTAMGTSAKIRIYDGTQPAGPDTAVSTQTMLVELTGNASAFAGAASGGVLTLSSITSGTAAATGTASWFRMLTSGSTAHIDGSVGVTGSTSDLELDNTSIASGQTVSATGWTLTNGQ